MNATAAGCAKPRRSPPAAAASPPSHRCSSAQTRPPVGSPPQPPGPGQQMETRGHREGRGIDGKQASEFPSSRFCEGLLFTHLTSVAPVPLVAAAALASCSGPEDDVVKRGYMGKLERNHRRYFVLRAGSHTGPSRLEWYVTEEKFAATQGSSGKAALFGSSKQRVIYLRCCFGVSRIANSRKGHMVALYAKDQTMVLVAEDQGEQEEWYLAIRKLIDEERRDGENGEGEFEEEDDGYCTLPPAANFREVWPVTVKPRGLGRTKSLAGETRLCLSATSLVLVKVGACGELPSVSLPLLSVRRFGHSDELFFLELGRSAPNGPGEIWMEAGDQGDPALAQHMHEVVRETMRALRALPDFSCSPTSNHNQPRAQLASKRGRPKCREKVGHVRPLASPLSPPSRSPGQTKIPAGATQCHLEPRRLEKTDPESTPSFTSNLSPLRSRQSSVLETGSYVEMMMDRHLPVCKVMEDHGGGVSTVTEDPCEVLANKVEGWALGEEEGLGYMMMSPQDGHCCPASPQDDYMTMASPHAQDWTASSSSSLQMSFNSSTSYNYSALHQSNHQANEPNQADGLVPAVQQSEPEASQSEMLIIGRSSPARGDAGQEQEVAKSRHLPVQASGLPTPIPITGPGNSRPVQANPVHSRPIQAAPVVRRYWLSSCLPSCLQAEHRS